MSRISYTEHLRNATLITHSKFFILGICENLIISKVHNNQSNSVEFGLQILQKYIGNMGDSKRFKISSVANARKLIDDHPFAPKSGNLYVADITPTRALASSGGTFTSPSGRPMRYASQSRRNRTLDEMNERIESVGGRLVSSPD